MKRRIFAWALLVGFVLLLLNLMVFKFYWQLSMVIYLIIAFAFLLYNSKVTRAKEAEKLNSLIESEPEGDENAENPDENE